MDSSTAVGSSSLLPILLKPAGVSYFLVGYTLKHGGCDVALVQLFGLNIGHKLCITKDTKTI